VALTTHLVLLSWLILAAALCFFLDITKVIVRIQLHHIGKFKKTWCCWLLVQRVVPSPFRGLGKGHLSLYLMTPFRLLLPIWLSNNFSLQLSFQFYVTWTACNDFHFIFFWL
jgi:hypothetical protein